MGIVPVGAKGVVLDIELEGVMAEKGRPYTVRFDLTPYLITLKDISPVKPPANIDPNEIVRSTTTHLGPSDIRKIPSPTSE